MTREHIHSLTKDDLVIKFYRASGKGGQNRNKRDTACRISHQPSGAVATCEDFREQLKNKREAFKRLIVTDKFRRWYAEEIVRRLRGH